MNNLFKTLSLVIAMLLLGACSNKVAKKITIEDANKIAAEFLDTSRMEDDDIDMLSDITLIDKNLVEAYKYMRPITNLETQQIIIIKPIQDKMEEVKKTLKAHLDNSIEIYDSYLPEEAAKLKEAELFTTDDLVILLVGEDAKKAKEKILE
ncbi:MAG: DUF4358 domain-containing protein [Ezakiella sp.]|nr:DUF4358 domain-containing protein [Bacillota bacterium]MDY3946918.1 DUF4358 domain-containing protein [Ezakiella sp.]